MIILKKKKGFTLIELIATMAIMSIAAGIIVNAFSSTLKLRDMAGANIDNLQNIKITEAKLYNDIRKSTRVVDPIYDDITKIYSLPADDDNLVNCENYCRARSFKPLIYIEKLDGSISCYAYEKSRKVLHNIVIPVDKIHSVSGKYYPVSYDMSPVTEGTDWKYLDASAFEPYRRHPPRPSIPQSSVVIDYISITESGDDTVYNSFNFVMAFNDSTYGNQVIIQSKIPKADNTYPYFLVNLTSSKIAYYSYIQDNIIAKSISDIGITASTDENIIAGKYYDIYIDGIIGKSHNSVNTRVALVDYTMNGGK